MKLATLMSSVYFFLLTLSVVPALGEPTPGDRENDVLYFSLVPKKNVENQISELRPLIRYLEQELNRPIKTIHLQSYQAVIEGILSQTIDFAILGPASYAKARARDPRVEAFASFSSQKGFLTPQGSFYYSVLFTLKDFGYESISDLGGKKIALTDPASTSGAVIPAIYFGRDTGKSLSEFFSSLTYTGSHDRSISAVRKHYVDAAFVSSSRIDEAVLKGVVRPEQIVVLWQSEPIHSDPFVFRGGLDSSIKEDMKKIMLSLPPELNVMLEKMKMIGIEEVDNEDYQAIHEIVAIEAAKENPSN